MEREHWNILKNAAENTAEVTMASDQEYGGMVLHYILNSLGSKELADQAYALALNRTVSQGNDGTIEVH